MTENGTVISRLRGAVPEMVKAFKQGRDVSGWAREIWEVDKYFVVGLLEASEPEERELARYIVVQGPDIPRDWNSRERAKILAIDAQIKTLIAYIEACEKAPGVIRGGLISDMKYKVKVLQKVASHFDSIRGQFVLKGKWTEEELRANRAAGRNISPDPDDLPDEDQDGTQGARTEPMTEEDLASALQEIEAAAREQGIEEPPEPEAEPRKTLTDLEGLVEQFRPAIMAVGESMNKLVERVNRATHQALEATTGNYVINTGFRTEDLLRALEDVGEEDPEKEDPPAILPGALMTPGPHYPPAPFIDGAQAEAQTPAKRTYRRKGETITEARARQAAKAAEPIRPKRPYNKKQRPVFVEVTPAQDPEETN